MHKYLTQAKRNIGAMQFLIGGMTKLKEPVMSATRLRQKIIRARKQMNQELLNASKKK